MIVGSLLQQTKANLGSIVSIGISIKINSTYRNMFLNHRELSQSKIFSRNWILQVEKHT